MSKLENLERTLHRKYYKYSESKCPKPKPLEPKSDLVQDVLVQTVKVQNVLDQNVKVQTVSRVQKVLSQIILWSNLSCAEMHWSKKSWSIPSQVQTVQDQMVTSRCAIWSQISGVKKSMAKKAFSCSVQGPRCIGPNRAGPTCRSVNNIVYQKSLAIV